MTASLRNQRIRIYAGSASTTNGVPDDSYAFQAEVWGRRTFMQGRAVVLGGVKLERQADAIVELASSVTVPTPAVLTVNGEQYRVVGLPLAHEGMQSQAVLCNRVVDADVTLTGG